MCSARQCPPCSQPRVQGIFLTPSGRECMPGFSPTRGWNRDAGFQLPGRGAHSWCPPGARGPHGLCLQTSPRSQQGSTASIKPPSHYQLLVCPLQPGSRDASHLPPGLTKPCGTPGLCLPSFPPAPAPPGPWVPILLPLPSPRPAGLPLLPCLLVALITL